MSELIDSGKQNHNFPDQAQKNNILSGMGDMEFGHDQNWEETPLTKPQPKCPQTNNLVPLNQSYSQLNPHLRNVNMSIEGIPNWEAAG